LPISGLPFWQGLSTFFPDEYCLRTVFLTKDGFNDKNLCLFCNFRYNRLIGDEQGELSVSRREGMAMWKRYTLLIGLGIVLGVLYNTVAMAVTGLDGSFGLNGRVAVELGRKNNGHAVLVQPDGKIVVAGSSAKGRSLDFSLLRFNANGTLDPTFNGDGSVVTSLSDGDDEALALALLADGRIIAAGYSHNGSDRDLAIVCYRQNGALDRRFGDRGVALTAIGNGNEEITAVAVGESNAITVVGSSEGTAGRILVAARYFANGELDSSFGEHGISLIGMGDDVSAEGVVERGDGTFVLSGTILSQQKSSALLVGLDRYGALNPAFGSKGIAMPGGNFAASEGYGLAIDKAGLIYVAGAVGLPGKRDSALFRFTSKGEADLGFGGQGVAVTRVSAEDDVLYDVEAGTREVAAGGFTTDAKTRQFLLLSYPLETPAVPLGGKQEATIEIVQELDDEGAPIQETKVNGNTRLQIRRLQIWNSDVRIQDLRVSDSLTNPSAFIRPHKQIRTDLLSPSPEVSAAEPSVPNDGLLARFLAFADEQVGAFFLPQAFAATDSAAVALERETFSTPKIFTTTFSEGESVGFALSLDGEGNILAVGTADGSEASSMVAARFAAEDLVDRISDNPGRRNKHITTATPTNITQTSITSGGEIAAALGKDVVRRGVVFALQSGPLYAGLSSAGAQETIATVPTGVGALTSLLVSDAVAAQTATEKARATAAGQASSIFATQFVKAGNVEGGMGTGAFVAQIDHLLPGTVYYLRAYALAATGEVYYGNQISVRTADACFIATASFGTFLHPAVTILRDFRDGVLHQHAMGRWLVEAYYTVSPPAAQVIAENAVLRGLVRLILLPFVGFSWLALKAGFATTACASVVSVVLFWWLGVRWHRVWGNKRALPIPKN
jgi:uncharacterized delta-60 repeat protein